MNYYAWYNLAIDHWLVSQAKVLQYNKTIVAEIMYKISP